MKYICLIYNEPTLGPQPGTPEFGPYMDEYFSLGERMKDVATVDGGEALQGVETATSVRVRAGKVETMDGPFAETREHLGGFYLIDAPNLEAALTFAAGIPDARTGTVELRPIMDLGAPA